MEKLRIECRNCKSFIYFDKYNEGEKHICPNCSASNWVNEKDYKIDTVDELELNANYKFKCKECGENVFVKELEEKDANYPCPKCNHENFTLYNDAKTNFEKIVINEDKVFNDKEGKYKYPTLSFISGVYVFFAYTSIVVAIIYFAVLSSNLPSYGSGNAGALILISSIAIGLGGYIFCMLFAEGIKLFINISKDLGDIKKKIK